VSQAQDDFETKKKLTASRKKKKRKKSSFKWGRRPANRDPNESTMERGFQAEQGGDVDEGKEQAPAEQVPTGGRWRRAENSRR